MSLKLNRVCQRKTCKCKLSKRDCDIYLTFTINSYNELQFHSENNRRQWYIIKHQCLSLVGKSLFAKSVLLIMKLLLMTTKCHFSLLCVLTSRIFQQQHSVSHLESKSVSWWEREDKVRYWVLIKNLIECSHKQLWDFQ